MRSVGFRELSPNNVLRIMRKRFKTLKDVLGEIKKYALVLKFLRTGTDCNIERIHR